MSYWQFAFIVAFLIIAVVIIATAVRIYFRAQVLDGGGRTRLATIAGIGADSGLGQPKQSETYRFSEANRYAAYLHRFTGIAVALFLVLHLFDVSLFAWSSSVYDEVHTLYSAPIMRIFECGLLFALVFHSLNGLRIFAIDVWDLGMQAALRILQIIFLVSVLITVAGSVVIIWPILT